MWSTAMRHTIVVLTEDVDISGATSPFDRPSLGPWLTEPSMIAQWDILAVASMDRVSRSLISFGTLIAQQVAGRHQGEHDPWRGSGATAEMMAKLVVLLAEWERGIMRERRASASEKLYARAGYNGGSSLPWGYMAEKVNGQLIVVPDPEKVTEVTEIIDEVLAGTSVAAVAEARGMGVTTLHRRLRNPALYGLVARWSKDKKTMTIIYGDDGLPLMREPVIDKTSWDRLQAYLDKHTSGKGQRHDANVWKGVLLCEQCENELFIVKMNKPNRPKQYVYYRHEKRQALDCTMRLTGDIEAKIYPYVLGFLTRLRLPVQVVIERPAEDHSAELEKIEA